MAYETMDPADEHDQLKEDAYERWKSQENYGGWQTQIEQMREEDSYLDHFADA